MPRVEILVDHNISIVRGREPDESGALQPTWTLLFEDRHSGDQVRFSCFENVRDFILAGLTSGLVVASDLPEKKNGR